MAESTLSLTREAIQVYMAFQVGWSPTAGDWSSEQQRVLGEATSDGLRRVYNAPILPGEDTAHVWSFLHPVTTIELWKPRSVPLATGNPNGTTTLTAAPGGPGFHPLSAGASVTFPTTTLTTTGDPNGSATLTIAESAFVSSMVNKIVTFADSGNRYTIVGFTGATQVTLDRSISGETAAATTLTLPGGTYTVASFTDAGIAVTTAAVAGEDVRGGMTIEVNARGSYPLPDDFGFLMRDLTHRDNMLGAARISRIGEQQLRVRQQEWTGGVGRPEVCATRYKAHVTKTVGQRWELIVHPAPDADYTVEYQYAVLPDALADGDHFPPGSELHTELFKAACMAALEFKLENQPGPHEARFQEALRTHVALDRQAHAPESLGYMRDSSDYSHRPMRGNERRYDSSSVVRYIGGS